MISNSTTAGTEVVAEWQNRIERHWWLLLFASLFFHAETEAAAETETCSNGLEGIDAKAWGVPSFDLRRVDYAGNGVLLLAEQDS